MSRRRALAVIPAVASTWTRAADAPKRLIGNLGSGPASSAGEVKSFEDWIERGLRARSSPVHGVRVEGAAANWTPSLLEPLARQLVQKRVEVIVCEDDDAAIAAARVTRTTPILFWRALAPVEQGLVDSLVKPGRNLTGTTVFPGPEFITKRLQFLREIAPKAERLFWIYIGSTLTPKSVNGQEFDIGKLIERTANGLGFATRVQLVRKSEEVQGALDAATRWGAQALSAGSSATGQNTTADDQRIVDFALRSRLPSAFSVRAWADKGGLLSYGVPPSEVAAMQDRWLAQLDALLRGTPAAEIPVEQPQRYELCINQKTARAIGLTVPPSVLARADAVIG